MRLLILGLVTGLFAGAAQAQPASGVQPATTTQCIEVDGRIVPAACRATASRLGGREDICTCPIRGQPVEVAVCASGQKPLAEGKALNVARRGASRDGSLVGDSVDGRPICAAPRLPNR